MSNPFRSLGNTIAPSLNKKVIFSGIKMDFGEEEKFVLGTILINLTLNIFQWIYHYLNLTPGHSCSLIKWNLQRTKITLPSIKPLYPLPSFWPINQFHVSNLNWIDEVRTSFKKCRFFCFFPSIFFYVITILFIWYLKWWFLLPQGTIL